MGSFYETLHTTAWSFIFSGIGLMAVGVIYDV